MRKYFWLLLLPLLLLGLYLTFYPQVNTAVYEHGVTQVISEWETQIEVAERTESQRPHPEQDAVLPYPELRAAMEAYNRTISEEGQRRLTAPAVYEEPALDLTDYALEENAPAGILSIPSIDLELPIYLGASKENLALGVAVLGGTSVPIGGSDTNCVIAGHRGYRGIPYFRYLDRLEAGDTVRLTNFWGELTYTVKEIAVIEPDDIDAILIQEGRDMLTLLTCHPYTVGTQRLVIYCERTS